jgi:hypothetical protein
MPNEHGKSQDVDLESYGQEGPVIHSCWSWCLVSWGFNGDLLGYKPTQSGCFLKSAGLKSFKIRPFED